MKLRFEIDEVSGGRRTVEAPFYESFKIGKSAECDLILNDPTISDLEATITLPSGSSVFWIKAHGKHIKLGDIQVKECEIPAHESITLGETKIRLLQKQKTFDLPTFPIGAKPWLSCTQEGRDLLWMAKKAAQTPLSIYIAGETGTGKEVMANLIHCWSDRSGGAFIPLHCGALSLSLIESELFGHVKGAFTGAHQHRSGALMQAHNGTLFLDEIGDLPLDIQVKLLRFLENGEIRPVGADKIAKANVRLLCATHHPLKKLVEEGKFRRDLYFRIASITLEIPTLKSRPDDIQMLAQGFAGEFKKIVSSKALNRLKAYTWPGNVRELRHAVERASGLAGPFESKLNEDAFDFLLSEDNIEQIPEMELGLPVLNMKEMERVLILKALKITHGNRKDAAIILGIARSTLFEMLKRHRILGPKAKMLERRQSYQGRVNLPNC